MNKSWRQKFNAHRRDMLVGLAIFVFTMVTFIYSPVHPLADSKYSLVVSQSLISHGSFTLDHYAIPRLEPKFNGSYMLNGNIYQIEWIGSRLYYYLPPGGSVLAVPYVALMNLFGISPINADGTYNIENELKLQIGLAALLMAALASVFYFASRLVLPQGWSIIIAVGGALGTQVWSTASRVLWSDTWGIFLLGLVVWMLLAEASGKARWRPILLASLLSWAYFVRPTNAIPILAITVYVLIYHRRLRVLIPYAATGLAWFALFVIYSWYHFGQVLPNYYLASRLTFIYFGEALAGNLISPARGLFIYVPALFAVIYLLVRYRKKIAFKRLVWLSLTIIVAHWIVTSGFPHWWGGHSYGPRLMAGIVPCLVLLGILGVQAMLKACEERGEGRAQKLWRLRYVPGGLLLFLSIAMNGIGATSYAASIWNDRPIGVDRQPSRIWDWRRPQFLAWFLGPPLPQVFPPADARIEFSRSASEPYLWYGWSGNEELFRWSDGREAAVIFALDEITDADLRVKFAPLIIPGKLDEQRIYIQINGQLIETLTLKESVAHEYSWKVPKAMLKQNNILTFGLPDATSPKYLGMSADPRALGIAVHWLEIQTENWGRLSSAQVRRTTVVDGPLPSGAYNAEVIVSAPPTELSVGEQVNVNVRVRNTGGAIWPTFGKEDGTYQIRLGNHWLDAANGNIVVLDDARIALPHDVRPGKEVELVLTIKAPQIPGEYILEMDMVQERITWFADEGSRTARMKVTVR